MKFLKPIKEKISKKEYLIFLIILLIPNILRQIIYYTSQLLTNSQDFIVSFETKAIYTLPSFPYLGIIEELIIGLIFALLWFKFRRLKFLSYAWVTDALFDYISVFIFILVGATPLQLLGLPVIIRFLLREVILFYVITGPLLYIKKVNIKKLSLIYTLIGLLILGFIYTSLGFF